MHLWLRAEHRATEQRVAVMPDGVKALIDNGIAVTVEDAPQRIIPTQEYADVGATIAPAGHWVDAPQDAVILGLKELPDDGRALTHRHIMFGHAFKGQHAGHALLRRFQSGGGVLYDLEYLTDPNGRRVAAFGYWAGFAGAAVGVMAWLAQRAGGRCPQVAAMPNKDAMVASLKAQMPTPPPTAIVIGALGRVGRGAADLCAQLGIDVTPWDIAETTGRDVFPEILEHDLFFNCILAAPGVPVFVGPDAVKAHRRLSVIGDIACDPDSNYNPIPIYDTATSWVDPVARVADTPVLDVMAIDNLPSLLPAESSADFAQQLLPHLLTLPDIQDGMWGRARAVFGDHVGRL